MDMVTLQFMRGIYLLIVHMYRSQHPQYHEHPFFHSPLLFKSPGPPHPDDSPTFSARMRCFFFSTAFGLDWFPIASIRPSPSGALR